MSEANAKFAIELFRGLTGEHPCDNILCSPVNTTSALGVLALASGCEQAAAIEKDVPDYECENPEGVHTEFSKIVAALHAPSNNYTLSFANRLYGDSTIDLIHDSIDCLTQLLQVNALYFKGKWQVKFDEELTVEAPFYSHDADARDCQTVLLMNRKGIYNTATVDICGVEVQVLEIPCQDNEMSFFVLLPTDCSPEALQQLEDSLTHEHLLGWSCDLKPTEVDVFIPKFSLERSVHVIEYLDLPNLQDPEKADFSQATTTEGVALTQLVHDTFIEIDEEGGEEPEARRCPRDRRPRREAVEVVADHPFLYFILHNCTQSILALGRFAKPE
ncbi:leukocyte elastase inhibitor-like [Pogona vitticeps]